MTESERRKLAGQLGEELYVKIFNSIGFEPITNIYLPLRNGGTTEIDMLIADYTGIYPVEVKNIGATIYGKDTDRKWTLSYWNGKKYPMYNPIMQNDAHRKTLERILGMQGYTLSFVVFTDRADLTNVVNKRKDVLVCTPETFIKALNHQVKNAPKVLTLDQLKMIHSKLQAYTNVDEEIKRKHIKYVKKKARR